MKTTTMNQQAVFIVLNLLLSSVRAPSQGDVWWKRRQGVDRNNDKRVNVRNSLLHSMFQRITTVHESKPPRVLLIGFGPR